MPSLSATMEEGTIVSWRVKEGERIGRRNPGRDRKRQIGLRVRMPLRRRGAQAAGARGPILPGPSHDCRDRRGERGDSRRVAVAPRPAKRPRRPPLAAQPSAGHSRLAAPAATNRDRRRRTASASRPGPANWPRNWALISPACPGPGRAAHEFVRCRKRRQGPVGKAVRGPSGRTIPMSRIRQSGGERPPWPSRGRERGRGPFEGA